MLSPVQASPSSHGRLQPSVLGCQPSSSLAVLSSVLPSDWSRHAAALGCAGKPGAHIGPPALWGRACLDAAAPSWRPSSSPHTELELMPRLGWLAGQQESWPCPALCFSGMLGVSEPPSSSFAALSPSLAPRHGRVPHLHHPQLLLGLRSPAGPRYRPAQRHVVVHLPSPQLWEAVELPMARGTGSASEEPGPPSQPDGAPQLGASRRVSHTSGLVPVCLQHPSARCEQSPAPADAMEDLLERRSSPTVSPSPPRCLDETTLGSLLELAGFPLSSGFPCCSPSPCR